MTNMSKKILLASPHMSDEGYEQQFIKEAFDTNWIAPLGENVNKFEEEIANYVGVKTGAALVLAGLCAKGKTKVENIEYILRGYENLDQKLRKLGANIKIEKVV